MLTKEQAQILIAQTLSYSTFPECDISLSSFQTDFIRFALNGVTTSGFVVEQNMIISSTRDGKTGSTAVDQFTPETLREAVRRTEALAAISPENPEHLPDIGPQKYAQFENFADSTASARNPAMVPAVRTIIEGAKGKGLVAAGYFECETSASAVGNKNGNFGFGRTTQAHLSTTVRDAAGTSSGWASQPAVRIEDISGDRIATAAISKCEMWKNPRRLEPGKYTVVLEPTAVGDLVQLMGFPMQARAAEEGRSFLSKRGGGTYLGETMFPDFVSLRTDPFNKLYSSLPWGGGGGGFGFGGGGGGASALPTDRIAWIENGVVKNLFYDRYWANKAGKEPTPAPNHLVLDGGSKSLADQIAAVDRGLLVTRFWYIRSLNPQTVQLTGLTRDGLFLIENGKVTGPVVNFRFNESPVRMLKNTIALGEPIRVRGGEGQGMIAPPITVKEFNFSSVSDAV